MIYQGNDFGDFYLVSNTGEIQGVKTGKIRKKNVNHEGYYFVGISFGSRKKFKCIKNHKAVAETFTCKPDGKEVVNHIDGNKLNNNAENLEWVTYSENLVHAYRNGLINTKHGAESPNAKFESDQIDYIRENYIPRDEYFGCRSLARRFNVSHTTISDIINYKIYTNQ